MMIRSIEYLLYKPDRSGTSSAWRALKSKNISRKKNKDTNT